MNFAVPKPAVTRFLPVKVVGATNDAARVPTSSLLEAFEPPSEHELQRVGSTPQALRRLVRGLLTCFAASDRKSINSRRNTSITPAAQV